MTRVGTTSQVSKSGSQQYAGTGFQPLIAEKIGRLESLNRDGPPPNSLAAALNKYGGGSHGTCLNKNSEDVSFSSPWVPLHPPRYVKYETEEEEVPEGPSAVSYTHLRAHETPEHLVCRLLLEKKKTNTSPL
eukprot:TRINITY_DN10304_c0_g2_i1.p1 TRINITY_DN10304_c0_g2~~TRINITY_DN10304_c0_g2_i1.p1  ORF type:complete len:132 (+),score=4.58 TRINITY_DN10304_c0_g2_i1:438-833(+)